MAFGHFITRMNTDFTDLHELLFLVSNSWPFLKIRGKLFHDFAFANFNVTMAFFLSFLL